MTRPRPALLATLAVGLLASPLLADRSAKPAPVPARVTVERDAPDFDFDAAPVADAVNSLGDATGLNLSVNWRALEQVGISKSDPVTVRLTGVPLGKVLQTILDDVAPGQLTYYADGNVVRVTTRKLADEDRITKIYPVGDLTADVPDFAGPRLSLTDGGGSGGGGGGLFSGQNDADDDQPRTRSERGQAVVDLITTTVRPEVWDVNGGQSSVRFFNGSLIVNAPRSVHALIGR